jgi:hypothetical protein
MIVRSQQIRNRQRWAGLGLGLGLCLWTIPTLAAERIVLRYGPIARSLPISDLRQLADTGQPTSELRTYLKLAKQDPQKVQAGLINPIEMDPVELDRLLNSVAGNLLLSEIGEIIHTPSGRANQQALRSALILDASADRQITLIDTLEQYPTPEVEVEGQRLVKVVQQFNRLRGYARTAEPATEILGAQGQPLIELLMGKLRSILK